MYVADKEEKDEKKGLLSICLTVVSSVKCVPPERAAAFVLYSLVPHESLFFTLF